MREMQFWRRIFPWDGNRSGEVCATSPWSTTSESWGAGLDPLDASILLDPELYPEYAAENAAENAEEENKTEDEAVDAQVQTDFHLR